MAFNGFISYSHAADGRLAPAIQRGLHRLAKPWHRRRALWIFRDQTGLAVTPTLWSSIQRAMDTSEWFVLLASPEAAQSPWVNREIEHWLATKSPERILPVVTDGVWEWDPVRRDFAENCSAVPAALRGTFAEEPFFLDLRWARDDRQLSLRHSRFRDAIARLAAPMHGISKDELEGEDIRLHRRALRWRTGAVTTLVVMALVASVAGVVAVRNAGQATAAAAEVRRQQRVAAVFQGNAERSAEQARRQQEAAVEQEARLRQVTVEVREQEELARQQRGLADRAGTEATRQQENARRQRENAARQQENARRQQRNAAAATKQAREQQSLAKEQQRLAKRWAEEARRQEQLAREQAREAQQQRELAQQWAAKALEAQDKAEQQQRIAIGQRLINEATAAINDDPKTALRLGMAAQKIVSDAPVRSQLAGLVTSTRFAGTLNGADGVGYVQNDVLVAADRDGTMSEWNVADPAHPVRLSKFPGTGPWALSPDGWTLAAGGGALTTILWDLTEPSHPQKVGALHGEVGLVAFSPDGHMLAAGDWERRVALWDIRDRAQPRKLSTVAVGAWDFPLRRVVFSSDANTMVIKRGTRPSGTSVIVRARFRWPH
jgi:hypothetical protein